MKKQVLSIHGGDVFNSYEDYLNFLREYPADLNRILKKKKWKSNLQDDLGEGWEVFNPQMPNYHNAKYAEWKIWFEKFLPFLQDGVILIGSSLGGIFLVKYLSENEFPVKISVVYLIAAPFSVENKDANYTLGDFALSESLDRFEQQAEKIFLYHSVDDPIIPFSDIERYAQAFPKAKKVVFQDRGHFNQEHFPEIVDTIKKLAE